MTRQSSNSRVEEELLTIDQACARLFKSRATLAKWRCEGTGPDYIKVGKTVLYPRSAIEKVLSSGVVRLGRVA